MEVGAETNNQIKATVDKFFDWNIPMKLLDVYNNRKTTANKALQQAWKYQKLKVLRCADIKRNLFLRGIECVQAGMAYVYAFQDFQDMAIHGGGLFSRPHAITGVDEQLVVEAHTQLFQAVADGGLADAKGFRDLGDAALFVYGNEHHQILHIEFSEQITNKHKIRLDENPRESLFFL